MQPADGDELAGARKGQIRPSRFPQRAASPQGQTLGARSVPSDWLP